MMNKVYQMDNLDLMKSLDGESVDLIYCDILYNTKRKFKDYVDNLGSTLETVEWYKPRLIEMYRILKKTGSIYLHMDWRLAHYLKVEMDKIFSENNFRNHIRWKRQPVRGAKARAKQFGKISDDILFYTKSDNYTWNGAYKEYDQKFIKGNFKPNEEGRLFRTCDLGDYSEDSIKKFENENKIYTTKNGKKRLIRYLDEERGESLGDIWTHIPELSSQTKERVGYDTQKPKFLLETIIKASSDKGDLVADFFMGSGSSLVVAKELGRDFVGCDISERAVEVTNKRLNEINT